MEKVFVFFWRGGFKPFNKLGGIHSFGWVNFIHFSGNPLFSGASLESPHDLDRATLSGRPGKDGSRVFWD